MVTRKTEDVWLDAIEGKRSGHVLEMLRGKGKGALPTDPVDPKKLRYRIVFEDVSAEDFMLHKQVCMAAAEANCGTCSDTELVRASAVAILSPSAVVDPAPTRRKVFVRDKFRCTVPWCTATRFLAIHHIVHREHGGGHALNVLTLLCDGHHKQHHEGLLLIRGQAPDALELVLTSVPAGTEPESGAIDPRRSVTADP